MTRISSVTAALLQLGRQRPASNDVCYANNYWPCRAMSAAWNREVNPDTVSV
jgi:hypothetical protein